jgi:hypothetical protein
MNKTLIASALATKMRVAGTAHASPAQQPDAFSQAGMAFHHSHRFHVRRTASDTR